MDILSTWWSGGSSTKESDLKGAAEVGEKVEPAPSDDSPEKPPNKDGEVELEGPKKDTTSEEAEDTATSMNSESAINAAKDLGNFLFNVAKVGTQKVTETATKTASAIQKKVEENVMIVGEFHKEQEKFIKEKNSKRSDAAVPPWVGYNEENQMKEQILALSQDKRNFLRNPPAGVQFQFEFNSAFPIAMATLQEDENLQKMRFFLVPSKITEEHFWRNYFYRVSLIKQSSQLTSLASSASSSGNSGEGSSKAEQTTTTKAATETDGTSHDQDKNQPGETKAESSKAASPEDDMAVDPTQESPLDDGEFISDAFQSELDQADLKKGMEQLGMNEEEANAAEVAEWERELQKELSDYEVVVGDVGEDEEWEQEINSMLDAEADDAKTS